jgi:hypothetical protein
MANFYLDAIRSDPRFQSPKRVADMALLEPVTRARVEAIIAGAAAEGIELLPWETFRSSARQIELFERGASKLRDVGVHNYGLACDLVKVVGGDPSWKGDFAFLGRLARVHGLVWGGDWGAPGRKHKFVDAVHVQRCTVARQTGLFRGEWYPGPDYDPYRDLESPVTT